LVKLAHYAVVYGRPVTFYPAAVFAVDRVDGVTGGSVTVVADTAVVDSVGQTGRCLHKRLSKRYQIDRQIRAARRTAVSSAPMTSLCVQLLFSAPSADLHSRAAFDCEKGVGPITGDLGVNPSPS